MHSNKDWLEFRLDGDLQDRISGNVDWQQKSYNVTGAGSHTLKWRYVKDSSASDGNDCGWVDCLQWSGYIPVAVPTVWDAISYTYGPAGRRIAKAYDDTTIVKYLYDGDHCIAEYDSSDQLLRKYIHGPGVDQPICMVEVADAGATYYYHFDGLGSVVALSDEDGDTVQLYEYSVYGRVAASDPNHTNPFMFTGRRFDADTGLYYYRARYYNPYIGRFLQTDPIGYGDGMNIYAYCGNNPVMLTDPSGEFRWENPKTHEVVYEGLPFYLPDYVWYYKWPVFVWKRTTEEHKGGPWTVQNFLWHYKYGDGQDLLFYHRDDSFVKQFAGSEQISAEVERFKASVRAQIADKATELSASGGITELFNIWGSFSYNFASRTRFIWLLALDDPNAALYVLGHGTMKMNAVGKVAYDGSYYVTFGFKADDQFADVFGNAHRRSSGPRSGWWQDCDNCTPFDITIY